MRSLFSLQANPNLLPRQRLTQTLFSLPRHEEKRGIPRAPPSSFLLRQSPSPSSKSKSPRAPSPFEAHKPGKRHLTQSSPLSPKHHGVSESASPIPNVEGRASRTFLHASITQLRSQKLATAHPSRHRSVAPACRSGREAVAWEPFRRVEKSKYKCR